MCGIAGIVNFSAGLATGAPAAAITAGELQRMAQVLSHRGPDESGIYLEKKTGRCGLAHRRLSIIDLDTGQQPMGNEDGTVWISYNGECYNFAELRNALIAAGHRFKSKSDTEVIIHLYEQYDGSCVDYIRGMFAFAIWDERRGRLFLARDRMGKKPLYYGIHQGRFIFASQCKAILQVEGFPRRPDLKAIGDYLVLQYVPSPQSGFADIKQLPPAHTLTVNFDNFSAPEIRRYWSIPPEPVFKGSLAEAAELVRAELAAATKMRMISDVPLGAFLSGGFDSTIVVGLMSQASDQPIKTCTIGFTEQSYNELPYARLAARRFSCDHDEHVVTADCQDAVEKLSFYYDEPFADSSALPTYYLSHLARSKVTVALTGDGGDECFGGYDRYKALYLSELVAASRVFSPLAGRRFWQKIPTGEYRSFWRAIKRFMAATGLPPSQRYLRWMAVFDPDVLGHLLSESMARSCDNLAGRWGYFTEYFNSTNSPGRSEAARIRMQQAMYADGNAYLPGDLNTKIDRASMSIGLELRCPFQDHKVVELAYSLPVHYRHNGLMSKVVLRRAFKDLLPASIRRRRKMGFGVPVGRWFRKELRQIFMDTVLSAKASQRGYFQKKAIETLLEENDRGQEDHGQRLWALLMLELWHRRYIDTVPQV